MLKLEDFIRSVFDFPVPGIHFRDITPLLESPVAFRETVRQLADAARAWGRIDKIAAPEARGFIFAAPLALELEAGLTPIRKPGKLPYKTVSQEYSLEYGTNEIQMHEDAVKPGEKVLILDDLLATGGTTEACRQLLEKQGADVIGALFLIELPGLKGREKMKIKNVTSLIMFEE
ncbi:MAG: adenine phosphoribosyltransferase [Thermoguttaceae bacterium]